MVRGSRRKEGGLERRTMFETSVRNHFFFPLVSIGVVLGERLEKNVTFLSRYRVVKITSNDLQV